METQSSADAAFLEHTAHYITNPRNSSKIEDCISLPKGIIVNMASSSRFLKPAEKPDVSNKLSHPKMAAYHSTNNDEISSNVQVCSHAGGSAHAKARELLCRRKMLAKPENFDKLGKPRDATRSAKTLLQPYMLPNSYKISDNKSALQSGRPGTRSMVSISNPATPTRTTQPLVSQIGIRKLASKSDLALSAQQKTKIKGLESLKAAGVENAESQEAKNRRIIQWLQGLPDVHSHSRPGVNSPKCDSSRLYHTEARQVSTSRPTTGRCNRSIQKVSHVPCSSNTFQSQTLEPQAKRPAKTAPELVEAATGSRSLHWLKSTGFSKLQHCNIQGDPPNLEDLNHFVPKADVTKRKSASPCQKHKLESEAQLETSLQKGSVTWRQREQKTLPRKSPSPCRKSAFSKVNWRPLIASRSSPEADGHLSHGIRLPFFHMQELKQGNPQILDNIDDQLIWTDNKGGSSRKDCNLLVSPKKSSRHTTSNALRAAMESRSDHEKRRNIIIQSEVSPEGSDCKVWRKNEVCFTSMSNVALLRKHFVLWRKFVMLRMFKAINAESFARDRLLRRYFLVWRRAVKEKRISIHHGRALKNNKCSPTLQVQAYYSFRLLNQYFHRWKWWTRWHQRKARRKLRDLEMVKKIEAYFIMQRPKCTKSESHNMVMEVPPCMSSSTHLIMDALSEVRRQGYFDAADNSFTQLVLIQPKSKSDKLVAETANSVEMKTKKSPSKSFRVTTSKIEKSPRGKRPRFLRCVMAGDGNDSTMLKSRQKVTTDNKGHQMARAMELRAAERKKRLAALMERKQKIAEEKLAMDLKKQEHEMQMVKEEKRRRREDYEAKMKANAQQAIEKMKRIQLEREQKQCAHHHYSRYLLRYGMKCWRSYVASQRNMAILSQEHGKRLALVYGIRLWEKICLKINEEKASLANDVYHRCLKKAYLHKWKDFQRIRHIREEFADHHYTVKFCKKILQAWHAWSQLQLPLRYSQWKKADELRNKKLLLNTFKQWVQLPKIMQAERIREERLNKLREKVQVLLPDFSPCFDKLAISNRSTT